MRAGPWVLALVLAATGCSSGDDRGPERTDAAVAGGGTGAAAPAPPVGPTADVGPGPHGVEAGVPVGFERTEGGAAAAATTFLSTLHALLVLPADDRREALVVITAEGAEAVVEETSAAFDVLDEVVAGAQSADPAARIFLREVPMAYRVSRYTDVRAQVEVWSLGVVIVEGVTQATEVWSTNQVELVWEEGDWRVWGWNRQPGPQPTVAVTDAIPAAEVLDAIDGWEGYRYVPSP